MTAQHTGRASRRRADAHNGSVLREATCGLADVSVGEANRLEPNTSRRNLVTGKYNEDTMIDPSKRCMHCAFYDDFNSKCKAHPPAYSGETQDEDGEMISYYTQPIIDYHWSDTCGEWQDGYPGKTADERFAEIRHAAGLDTRVSNPSAESGDAMSDRPVTAQDYLDSQVEIASLRLTDAEREAVQEVIDYLQPAGQKHQNHVAATLRGLLERLG